MIYHWKSFLEYFQATLDGLKTHEYRTRASLPDVQVGHTVVLEEFDRDSGKYTGRVCELVITFIDPPADWIPSDHVLMSVKLKKSFQVGTDTVDIQNLIS